MKKLQLSLLALVCALNFSYAQNTTTWPSSGNVGINVGSTTPVANLTITPATVTYTNIASTLIAGAGANLGTSVGSYLYPFEFQNTSANVNRLQFAPYRRVAGSNWPGTAYRLQFAVDNSFTNGSKAFIEVGASDLNTSGGGFISLGTEGNDRLTVAATGYVGIGTTSPGSILSVATGGNSGASISGNTYASLVGDLALYRTNTQDQLVRSTNIWIADDGGASVAQNYHGQLSFWSYVSGVASENMRILPNGNVGVGVSNPLSTFQVDEGSSKLSIGEASGAALNYGTSYIGFNAARYNNNTWRMESDGLHDGGGAIYGDVFGNLNFVTMPSSNGANYYELTDAQVANNVSFQITPSGVTHAKQIVVNLTGWPDYVFKPTYHLPTLAEVKTYIDKNQHLPDMPSEETVAKEGINLGEMNKLLTKKLEELTLYLIEKDKVQSEQEKVITAQDVRLKALEQKLEQLTNTLQKN